MGHVLLVYTQSPTVLSAPNYNYAPITTLLAIQIRHVVIVRRPIKARYIHNAIYMVHPRYHVRYIFNCISCMNRMVGITR